jgi:hypothetical protein
MSDQEHPGLIAVREGVAITSILWIGAIPPSLVQKPKRCNTTSARSYPKRGWLKNAAVAPPARTSPPLVRAQWHASL